MIPEIWENLEFLDRKKAKVNWDNEDIEEDEGFVEPDPNPATHPGILAETPGVMMESDQEIATTAIEAVPVPELAAQAAAARSNTNSAQNTGVLVIKITGVMKEKKTPVIVIDNDSDNEDDGYDTDDTNAGMLKMVKCKYDSSDDKDDD